MTLYRVVCATPIEAIAYCVPEILGIQDADEATKAPFEPVWRHVPGVFHATNRWVTMPLSQRCDTP